MDNLSVARHYLSNLEKGDLDGILSLFAQSALVDSPLYGIMKASEFYGKLLDDTQSSVLRLDGVFPEEETKRIALLFDYHWTLASGQTVDFKVVDILEFNGELQIEKLTIIYDTVVSRKLLKALH
jgi:hypothetical protein